MIAFSGSLWARRWFCHNCITASLVCCFIFLFFYKCIVTSIPFSTDSDFEDSSSNVFFGVLPCTFRMCSPPGRSQSSEFQTTMLHHTLSISRTASCRLIQQCPVSKWMDSTFEACLQRYTCKLSKWMCKPRWLHIEDKYRAYETNTPKGDSVLPPKNHWQFTVFVW